MYNVRLDNRNKCAVVETNMNTVTKQGPLAVIALCLVALSITACGRSGDLYLPETPAEVKSSPTTQEAPKKEDDKKKQQEQADE